MHFETYMRRSPHLVSSSSAYLIHGEEAEACGTRRVLEECAWAGRRGEEGVLAEAAMLPTMGGAERGLGGGVGGEGAAMGGLLAATVDSGREAAILLQQLENKQK
ncbi:hypothetical protein Q7P35_004341 [Cladosporium inversicolor]